MAARKPACPDRSEIIWIQRDPKAGREMKGRHPMLVLSPKSFDWRVRGGGNHPWAKAPAHVMKAALEKLDAICDICQHE